METDRGIDHNLSTLFGRLKNHLAEGIGFKRFKNQLGGNKATH